MKTRQWLFLFAVSLPACTPQLARSEPSTPEPSTAVKVVPEAGQRGSVFWSDFSTDPLQGGWHQLALPWQKFKGQWVGEGDRKYISVDEGYWESPMIPVQAFGYYKLKFKSRAAQDGFCWAQFYDKDDKEIIADDHENFWASKEWSTQEMAFRAHALATHVRVRFAANKSPIDIAEVSVSPLSSGAALAWTKSVRDSIPPIRYAPPKERGALLPITASRLKNGGTLRIVMLGDSICNDTSNSLYETQLHRLYPRTRFEVIASVRGGTGSTYYKDENRVQDFVLRFHPDLLIIAGISHSYDAGAMRSVIDQVRAHSHPDILIINDSITPQARMEIDYLKFSGLPEAVARENIRLFPQRLSGMANVEDVELLDMRSAWNDYLSTSPQPNEWFHRDDIHGNMRAKQVVGTILARYLAFVPAQ